MRYLYHMGNMEQFGQNQLNTQPIKKDYSAEERIESENEIQTKLAKLFYPDEKDPDEAMYTFAVGDHSITFREKILKLTGLYDEYVNCQDEQAKQSTLKRIEAKIREFEGTIH